MLEFDAAAPGLPLPVLWQGDGNDSADPKITTWHRYPTQRTTKTMRRVKIIGLAMFIPQAHGPGHRA